MNPCFGFRLALSGYALFLYFPCHVCNYFKQFYVMFERRKKSPNWIAFENVILSSCMTIGC